MYKKLLSLILTLLLLLTACRGTGATGNTADAGNQSPPCTGEHSDADDNGRCDTCSHSVIATVDFYVLNDLHGKFTDNDRQPGVDELTSYLRHAAARDDYALFLSSGDMWQGSSESNLTRGAIVTDWMNQLGFAAMTLGNHEFDWGEEAIAENAALANFPFLAINIYDKETNTRAEYAEASLLKDLGDVQIGIIGAIGDCYSSISGDKVEDIYFKVGDQLTELVKAEADRLRAAGADYIVYTIHDGYGSSSSGEGVVPDSKLSAYYSPVLSGGYVDLVFEGHTHQNYTLVDARGVYHLQGGGENRGISHAEVRINFAGGSSAVNTADFVASDVYGAERSHPIVKDLLEKYAEQIAPAYRVVGVNPTHMNSYAVRELVADLYYEVGQERWGEDYDIVLGGGFISVRSPYEIPRGEVTYSTLQMVLPFDNPLVLCSIRGRDLLSRFIHTDNENYFVEYDPAIVNTIDPDGTYYIVTDTYSSQYAYNRLTVVAEYDAGIFARDLVADWLGEQ